MVTIYYDCLTFEKGSEMTKTTEIRTRTEAKKLMWEYYRDNKSSLPTWIGEFREEILTSLINGSEVVDVFRSFDEIAA